MQYTNILSLPAEIIAEIAHWLELPKDIVRFSTACKDFYNCIDLWKVKWFANMRNIVKEINSIEYTIADEFPGICEGFDDLKPKSCRKRDWTHTYSYYIPLINDELHEKRNSYINILNITQRRPLVKLNRKYIRDIGANYGNLLVSKQDKLFNEIKACKQVCIFDQTCMNSYMVVSDKTISCWDVTTYLYH